MIGWKLGKPWVLWIGIVFAVLVLLIAVRDLVAMFRASNWLLRIGTDGVWINLRSYRDRDVVADALSVVHLKYAEIASVGQHTESYTTPSERASGPGSHGKVGGSTEWRDKFLEIELNHDQTEELKAALNDLRFPPVPPEPASGPASGPARAGRSPPTVWIVNPSLLRIGWVSAHGPRFCRDGSRRSPASTAACACPNPHAGSARTGETWQVNRRMSWPASWFTYTAPP